MAITDLAPWRWGEKKVPVRRDMTEPFHDFQERMNDMFDRFFNEVSLAPFGGWGNEGTFQPRIDVGETETEIKISAELPGLDEKDIEVSLAHDMLTISGEKKEEKEDKGKNYYRIERSYGSFRRSLRLPTEVEQDKVDATFKNGVLTITLPKTPEAQQSTKKITIKST
jgi:HSP20 family protein